MMKKSNIKLERDPGFVARAFNSVRNSMSGERPYFDGIVTERGFSIDRAKATQFESEGARIAVQAMPDGSIPFGTYQNLVRALKECRFHPETHGMRVEYLAVRPTHQNEVHNVDPIDPTKPRMVPVYDEKRGLQVDELDLRMQVGFSHLYKAA